MLIQVHKGLISLDYEALSRKDDAINWYKKTLAVNPNFEEAKNRLKELEGAR
jgi:hypothetical protein